MTGRVQWVAAFVVLCGVVAGCSRVENTAHVDGLRTMTAHAPAWVAHDALAKRLWPIEQHFYEARGFAPAWIDGDAPTAAFDELIAALRGAEQHGIDPASYGVATFEQTRDESRTRFRGVRFEPAAVPELDARLTYAYLRYAAEMLGWTSYSKAIDPTWITASKKEDLAARLQDGIAHNRVRRTLDDLAPTHPQYKGLQAALARERTQPSGHIDQLRMNLERWRWVPRDLGDRYILVNVPSYQLQVMEGDTPALAMRVVVGDPEHRTPIFSDRMTYLVFSPYWNIPEEILRNETLPRIVADPDYLTRNHIEVVATDGRETVDPTDIDWSDEAAVKKVRFRQAPGEENALGLVKFIFPNHFDVYLHDTPSDKLFFKPRRALSHGCVRVEKPVALAEYVMQDRPEWTMERITTAMHAQQEQTVPLKERLPVHIGYWTAWVQPDGHTVSFTDDPYGYDAIQLRLRAKHEPKPGAAPAAGTTTRRDAGGRDARAGL